MPAPYKTSSEQYESAIAPCSYCVLGKCAERKAAGLCHCGDHAKAPKAANEPVRTSKESVLATGN